MPTNFSSLKAKYSAIVDAYNNTSSIFPEAKIISEWTAEDCKMWSKCITERYRDKALDPHFYPEMLAVIKHANKLATDQELRVVQLLSLLLLLDAKDKGRLAEIAPAEGKTCIISMFAVIKYLQGKTVDVVTSSPVLADFAVKEKQKFYALFNATVACNWDEKSTQKTSPLESGLKACYSANIVYGDAYSFQWDALRHEYEQEDTRGERPYHTVIIDEVDSLLIDDAAHSAQLAGPRPAFEFLEPLLVACWQELIRINQGFSTIDGKLHWQAEPQSESHEIADQQEFLVSALTDYLNTLVNQPDSPLFIPKHLKEFASEQAKAWAQSSVLAHFTYTLGKHYTIMADARKRLIAPIDYLNTGVIHTNSNWPDGLHQFLQMKEGLKLSVESLVACYISNMSYFKRYNREIYGLTGTLGAEAEQQLLAETYNMDFVKVPTHKPISFTEHEGVLATDTDSWLAAIANNTLSVVRSGRAVLIICESMNAVAEIQKILITSGIQSAKIKRYTKTDECSAIEQQMNSGEILIATNLAGRGTDLKIAPEVAAAGGLHVCVTFLPRNLRVEYQAFRRAARQGNPGSAQLIINKKEALALLHAHGINTDSIQNVPELKKQRDLMEIIRLNQIREHEIKKIAIKDALFEEFCAFSNKLGSKKRLTDRYRLKDIEELWSVWLHKTIVKMDRALDLNRDQIMEDFNGFKINAEQLFKSGQIHNPCYLVGSGNDFCFNQRPKLAIAEYNKAIALDATVAVHAYYNRALALIKAREDGYKQQAISDLCMAQKIIIETLIPQIQSVPILASFVPGSTPNADNDLSRQAGAKVALYKKQLEHIDKALSILKTTKGHIEISRYHSLTTTFSPGDISHESEIVEFNAAGLEYFFDVAEAWFEKENAIMGAICCAFLGLCQIVVGTFCYATGNVFLGEILIKEGVGDVMYALRKAIDGNFSWKEYREHKAISVAITVATTGIDKIKQKAQTASKTSKGVTQQSANNARQNTSLEHVRSENALRAKQLVAKTVIQRAAQEVASVVTDRVIDVSIKHFKEDIKQSVKNNLLDDLDRVDVKNAVDKLINVHQQAAILKIAFDIINHQNGKFARMFKTVAKGIVAHLNSTTAAAVRLFTLHEALSEIKRLTDTFSADFSGRVIALANSLPESRSPMLQQKVDEIRISIYDQIIDTITQGVMGQLHHGVAKPIVDQITEDQVQKIADALHRFYVRKTTQPPQSLVVRKPIPSSVPPEKVPVEILPQKPGKGLLYSEIFPGGFYLPGGGMDVSQFTFPSAIAPQSRFNRPASEYGVAVVQAAKNLVKPTIEFFTDCNLISVSQWPKPHPDNHHPLALMSQAAYENPQLVVDARNRMHDRFKTLKSVGSFLWDTVILWDTRPTGTMTDWSEPMNQLQTDAMDRMTNRMRKVTYFGKWVVKEATGPQLTEIGVVTAVPFVPKVYRTIGKAKQNYSRFGTIKEPYLFPDLHPEIKAPIHSGFPPIFSPQELQSTLGTKRGIYVVNPEGKLILGSQQGKIGTWHYHSCYAKKITAGGEYSWNGIDIQINNNTGHFRAYGDHVEKIAVRAFKNAGFEQVTYTKYSPLNFQDKLDSVITSYLVTDRNPTWSGAIAHLDREFTASLIYTSPVKKSLSPEVISLLDKKFSNPLFKRSDHSFREEIPRLLREKVFPGVDTLKNSMVVASPVTIGFFNQTRAEDSPPIGAVFLYKIFSLFIPAAEAATIPTLKTNSCQRPYFEDAQTAFVRVNGYANGNQVGDVIGGTVKKNIDDHIFLNMCALRVSYAVFNAPEVQTNQCKIPLLTTDNGGVPRQETVSGRDGLQYLFRVNTMIAFLTKVWGSPDYDGRKNKEIPSNLRNERGVSIKLMPGGIGFTGHAQVTDNVIDYDNKVLFWKLPSRTPPVPKDPIPEHPISSDDREYSESFY